MFSYFYHRQNQTWQMCFPCLLLTNSGFFYTKLLKRVVTFLPSFHHLLLAWWTLSTPLHHRAFWKVTRDYQDSQSEAPSPSMTSQWHSELSKALFLEMRFYLGFGHFTNSCFSSHFLGYYFAVSSLFILLFNVKVSQGPVLEGLLISLFYTFLGTCAHDFSYNLCGSQIYMSSSEFQIHITKCLLQIPVDQHVQKISLSFSTYLFHLSKPPHSLSQEITQLSSSCQWLKPFPVSLSISN